MRLPILLERDRPLLNLYSVMEVNPANAPNVNTVGGKAFADFTVSADVQKVIKTFGGSRSSWWRFRTRSFSPPP